MTTRRRLVIALIALGVGAPVGWATFRWLTSLPLAPARRALEAGQYAQAAQLAIQRLESGHPADQEAMLLAARSFARLGQWEQAEVYFAQVPLREADDLRMRARGLEMRRLWDEAARVYEEILRRWPADGHALQHLAAIRSQQLRTTEALTLARRLMHVPSHRVIGCVMTGTLEHQLYNHGRAVEAFEEALRLSPELQEIPGQPGDVLQLLAEALIQLGRSEDAERHALRARALSRKPDPCWILGQARLQQGDEEGARAYWEEALARDPRFVRAIQDLGQLYLRRGDPGEALRWFLRAKEIDPENAAVQYALDTTYRYLGQQNGRTARDGGTPPEPGQGP